MSQVEEVANYPLAAFTSPAAGRSTPVDELRQALADEVVRVKSLMGRLYQAVGDLDAVAGQYVP
jgi:hypothetical protein